MYPAVVWENAKSPQEEGQLFYEFLVLAEREGFEPSDVKTADR
jgi:hypothetical protein